MLSGFRKEGLVYEKELRGKRFFNAGVPRLCSWVRGREQEGGRAVCLKVEGARKVVR